MSDPRFARLKNDPRFRKPRKTQNKVVVDQRFKSLLDEDNEAGKNRKGKGTQGKAKIDKYGRKLSKNQDKDNLRRFYRMEDEEISTDRKPTLVDYARGEALMESSSEDDDDDEEDSVAEEVIVGRHISEPPVKFSRGKKAAELLDVDLDESSFADLDAQAQAYSSAVPEASASVDAAKPTSRIAAVNLDWDHVTAAHLFKVAASVLPSASSSKVLRVAVYPSDFGRERMEREEREGPPKELFKKGRGARADEVDSDEEVNEETIFNTQDGDDDYDDDALRQYQLDRLRWDHQALSLVHRLIDNRYYYAIITCNSAAAASHIYNELDGTELERSANVFDLSYVPEDMAFTQECRDECTSETQAAQKGMDFVTDALRHSKVKLTWDDDDPERAKITRRRMTRKEVDEGDFRALLASSSSEDEDEDEEGEHAASKRERMRALLLGSDNDDLPEGWGDEDDAKGGDLEITFMPALSSNAPKEAEDETTLDRYKRKQKEKKAQRKAKREQTEVEPAEDAENNFFGDDSDVADGAKSITSTREPKSKYQDGGSKALPGVSSDAELALLLAPDLGQPEGAEPKHFDMRAVLKAEKAERPGKKGRRKGKKDASDETNAEDGQGFRVDVKDERFSVLHDDHEFAIDPSNPHFKKTKGMQALLDERSKRQRERISKEEARAKEKSKIFRESTEGDRSLKSIVESVKRKSGGSDPSTGKRRKV
ncbi:pre-rRNA-processing protein ESF1 [Ceratobasidium sp. AG-Ba]|nr:pre-rRNA-processing protein ESF1 [Ceratobasidium sp. AG-Ba]QRW04992.1 pre-rRNA-processing protein ESF1 [Ceratobasidium sp. AG-Ba]